MEHYEEWDVTIPSLPSRSRLYRLEPIGIGTPYVESLTSYIARLAETHCVTPKNLITREIIPLHSQTGPTMNYYHRMNRFWNENATLNGSSPIARQWVEVLQSFTSCDSLIYLTMLTFSEVISLNRLLRRSKAWCSLCYEECRRAHQVIYEPLLWSLNGVDICLRHRQPLVAQCPYCQKTIPFLTQTTRSGYCPHCTHWLGSTHESLSRIDTSGDAEAAAYQRWVAEALGNLLEAAPNLTAPPPKKQIEMRIAALLDHYAGGSISELARLSGVSNQSLWDYLHRGKVPYFDTFLKFCFVSSVTPLEFLTTTSLPPLKDKDFIIESIPTVSRGKSKHVTEDDVRSMRQVLETMLAVDDQVHSIPSIRDIAQRMGFREMIVYKHCPDLSKAIVRRNKKHWAEEEHSMAMKQALETALDASKPESLVNIARQLHCDTSSMRKYFPDLCLAVVKRYNERFDYALIEQRLREILASDAEVPAVHELARDMGYARHIVRGKFPELCKQVSTRRSTQRRRRREERMAGICNEIRRVAFLLHEQDVYPSARQICNLLNNTHVLRTKEGHEAWRLALEELGYPTDNFKRYN